MIPIDLQLTLSYDLAQNFLPEYQKYQPQQRNSSIDNVIVQVGTRPTR